MYDLASSSTALVYDRRHSVEAGPLQRRLGIRFHLLGA
jgi:hypothetical protein